MIRIFQLTLVFIFFFCSSKEQTEQANWELENTETIEHFQQGNQKIQVIYSTLNTGLFYFTDTSIVVQTFNDTLLVEEIHYNLEDGDSTIWSRHINRYNSSGLLTEEIDSMDGALRHHSVNFYEQNKLVRSEYLDILPNYNDMMELVGTDTMKSEVLSFYDEHGRCTRVIALNIDELSSALTGTTKIDSTLTFNQFDDNNRKIGSVTLFDGDTTSMSRTVYDEQGREIKMIDASLELGANSIQFEYDERGNVKTELMISDDFKQLIRTEYNEQNRPVKRETYRPKTLANN
ncbi:MAG: hypothetical protein RIC06_06280 [Cyclobacteriaceae bacterium]